MVVKWEEKEKQEDGEKFVSASCGMPPRFYFWLE